MKKLWNNWKVAFAMFSKIPVPPADWSPENMQYMLCFFPWIGAVIGLISWMLALVGWHFSWEPLFFAVLLVLTSVLVTGGIHVDGLMDTADALASWQERERRLEILKDSHTGAFAVIRACCYFAAEVGAFSQLVRDRTSLALMCLVYVLSRCLSGLGVILLPKANPKGTVATFSKTASDRRVCAVLTVYVAVLAALMLVLSPLRGGVILLTALGVFFWYRHTALKYFGGTTGDLSGYFLCTFEMTAAVVLALLTV